MGRSGQFLKSEYAKVSLVFIMALPPKSEETVSFLALVVHTHIHRSCLIVGALGDSGEGKEQICDELDRKSRFPAPIHPSPQMHADKRDVSTLVQHACQQGLSEKDSWFCLFSLTHIVASVSQMTAEFFLHFLHRPTTKPMDITNVFLLLLPPQQDVIIILTSSCARFVPRRRGYNQLPTHASSGSTGRGRTSTRSNEDENRLIDQLDEEWDD